METLIHNQLKTLFTLALHHLSGRQPGLILSDGFRVVLPATRTIVQPDCFYVSRRTFRSPVFHTFHRRNPTSFEGAPDVIVEVASPTRADADRVVKMERYARSGVREFWLVMLPGCRGPQDDTEKPGNGDTEKRGRGEAEKEAKEKKTKRSETKASLRIHTLVPSAGRYRAEEPAAEAHSPFFNVTIALDVEKNRSPPRCRLTITKPNGKKVTFIV